VNAKLSAGLEKLGLEFSAEKIRRLEIYAECVFEFNKNYNLMKAANEDEFFVNHVLDSLAAAEHLQKIMDEIRGEKNSALEIGDIGSGGGCPGIPLAIFFEGENFSLVERMEKRCFFLEDAAKKIGLKNVSVKCMAASDVAENSFDVEVFRAFHPFDEKIAKLLLKMLKKNGALVAYKARSEKIRAEMDGVKKIIPQWQNVKLCVPFLEDHERNLVVVKK
jgi:16S rRNA (guanine527-N7)-methyltransferase